MASRNVAPTPDRVTRQRSKTPLPALPSKQSHAYGAAGKTNLRAQIREGGTDFSAEMQSMRKGEEDEDEEMEGSAPPPSPKKRGGRGRRKAKTGPEPVIPEEIDAESVAPPPEPEPEPEPAPMPENAIPDRTGTKLDSGAAYVGANRDGAAEMPAAAQEPSRARVFMRTLHIFVPRLPNLWNFLMLVSCVVLMLNVWTFAPVPASLSSTRDNFFWRLKHVAGIRPYDLPPTEFEERWQRFKHDELFSKHLGKYNMPDLQWAININFLERIERVEQDMRALRNDMSLHNETIALLKDMMPNFIAVRIVDGQYEIPEAFWAAMSSRLQQSNLTPLWRNFIRQNDEQVAEIFEMRAAQALDSALAENRVLSNDAFVEAIGQNNDWLAANYRQEMQKLWATNFDNLKEVARQAATDVVERSPATAYARDQLVVLTKANQVHNTYEALRTINWFSTGHGARVNPHKTSTTAKKPGGLLARIYRSISPLAQKDNSPIEALRRWDEATDCWCAALDKNQSAFISVVVPKTIYPDKLVVEHIPALATQNIMAAPRYIEIWIEMPYKKDARKVERAMQQEMPFYSEYKCSDPPPSKSHVCVGSGEYDIHLDNHVQTIKIWPDLKELGVGVNKFLIKATKNWGQNYTCFYRLRMTGTKVVPT